MGRKKALLGVGRELPRQSPWGERRVQWRKSRQIAYKAAGRGRGFLELIHAVWVDWELVAPVAGS